jgi:hypothetical protein
MIEAFKNGKKWTKTHLKMVLRHRVADKVLAAKLGRTVNAIRAKRSKFKNM